ncbi:MAG: class I SAM-dependent methyltransferase [Desulfomonilaceae bacterium]
MEQDSQLSKVLSYFDRNSDSWRDLYVTPRTTNELVLQERLNYALDFLSRNVPLHSSVLDVGCGSGSAAVKIAQMGYLVHGIDISMQMIASCREQLSRALPESESIIFTAGDFMDMELEASHYEAVIALGFLEYQINELAVLHRFHNIMKTGGLLIVSGPQSLSLSGGFGLTRLLLKLTGRQALALHGYSRSRMSKLLLSAGFEVIDIIRHGFALLPMIEERIVGFRIAALAHKVLTGLSSVLPIEAFANDIIVAAIKKR